MLSLCLSHYSRKDNIDITTEALIGFKNWGVVGPGFKTEGVVVLNPKSSTDGGTQHRIGGIIPGLFI